MIERDERELQRLMNEFFETHHYDEEPEPDFETVFDFDDNSGE